MTEYLSSERSAAKAFFDSSDVLAAYLTVVAVFALYLSYKRSRVIKKRYYFSIFLLSALALLTTEHFALLMVALLMVFAFFVIKNKKASGYLLAVCPLLPLLLFLFGNGALGALSNAFGIDPSLVLRKDSLLTSLSVFLDHFLLGVGSSAVGEAVESTANVYVAVAFRFGIFAIITFIGILALRIVQLNVYKKYFSDSTVGFYVDISSLSLIGILIYGAYFDVFANMEMLYFFIVIFATGTAALRVSKKEKEERLSYYRDLGRSDSADVDVVIK